MKNPYIWIYCMAGAIVYTQLMIWLLRALKQAL